MAFPPIPTYPLALDSNYTLFNVANTVETRLSDDNAPWSQEISIVAVPADADEIWPSNGYANIEGELLYYDYVELNSQGKVCKLKGCARQIFGKTKFNKKGTWIRSYVVAEHHNQLTEAILKTQNFIGMNFDTRPETLDWRIRNLQALEIIFDDYTCPDVNFTFDIVSNDPVNGIVASYLIQITPPGSVSNFRLDFGDGQFTTTALQGTHTYSVNATIDPVVQLSNDLCQIVQTPVERSNPTEPPQQVTNTFTIPIPETPDVPDFTVVPFVIPEPSINLPPLAEPCITLTGSLPFSITGPNIQMVSQVTITANEPIQITQSVVSIIGNIPSIIVVDSPPIPPTIIIDPPIPPTIVIVAPQSNITFDLDVSDLPRIEVDWGTPPDMEVALTLAKPVKTPQRFAADPNLVKEFGAEFADLFDVSQTMKVEYEPVGLPSEITVVFPDKDIAIDTSELFSRKIQIDSTSVNIPTDIYIHGPESLIPDSIDIDATELVEAITTLSKTSIKLDASDMVRTIKVESDGSIPDSISIVMPKPIPEKIIVESKMPDRIEVFVGENTAIPVIVPPNVGLPVVFPEKMPEVEMVWKGPPVEVKITMDQIIDKAADGRNCVLITPCPAR